MAAIPHRKKRTFLSTAQHSKLLFLPISVTAAELPLFFSFKKWLNSSIPLLFHSIKVKAQRFENFFADDQTESKFPFRWFPANG
jgi:hypothetical protein